MSNNNFAEQYKAFCKMKSHLFVNNLNVCIYIYDIYVCKGKCVQ